MTAPKTHQIKLTGSEQHQYLLLCSTKKFKQYKDPKQLFMDMVNNSLGQLLK